MEKKLVVLVLAGGTGRRFWPITADKLLLPVCGTPFIAHTVTRALPPTTSKIVIVANPANRSDLSSLNFPVPPVIVTQKQSLGIADAVLAAADELAGHRLLILFADVLVDQTLYGHVVRKAQTDNVFGVIASWTPPTYYPGGYLTSKGGRLTGITEKPGEGNEPGDQINISGHYIADADELVQTLRSTVSDRDDRYEKALTTLMSRYEFVALPFEGPVNSLKYPWHVLDCTAQILEGITAQRGKNVTIGNNVHIEGVVRIGHNVRIHENTKIIGPTYIGDGTIVGSQNIIRNSHIGDNCVTGFNTDITRSYIGDDCWFHSNYIGDSVLEGGVTMGAGAVLANVRLDDGEIISNVADVRVATKRSKFGAVIGRSCRIGVNSSIMPGVKIGARSFIGAGVVLTRDIGEDSFVTIRQTVTVTKNRKTVKAGSRNEFRRKLTS